MGLEFYIVNTNELTAPKADIEKLIVIHGGRKVQNYLPSTTHIIADKFDFKIRSLLEHTRRSGCAGTRGDAQKMDAHDQEMNVINADWIRDCAAQSALLDLEPAYMVHASEKLKKLFELKLDKFGDNYTQPLTSQKLASMLQNDALFGSEEDQAQIRVDEEVNEILRDLQPRQSYHALVPSSFDYKCSIGPTESLFDKLNLEVLKDANEEDDVLDAMSLDEFLIIQKARALGITISFGGAATSSDSQTARQRKAIEQQFISFASKDSMPYDAHQRDGRRSNY